MMMGVVLWKSLQDGSAVIWCEDQGDLAFLNSDEGKMLESKDYFDVGDVVHFDLLEQKNLRGVRNLHRLQDAARPGLTQNLQKLDAEIIQAATLQSAEIIPFRAGTPSESDEALCTQGRMA